MMNYSEICYKQTSLSKVIIRFDFLEFIENKVLFNPSVERAIQPNFPKKGMQQIIRFQTKDLAINPEDSKTENNAREGLQQEFLNYEGDKVVLSNKFVALELSRYTKYEDALGKFVPILSSIMLEMSLTALRIGIRYINEYGLANRIKAQKSFFTSPASAFADLKMLYVENISPIRSMALNEYVFDDMRLNFRYGLYNPQYPQPMKQPNFVLDYDCFCDVPIKGLESMLEHVNKGHDAIQKIFEHSITEKLRKVMCAE